MDLLYIFIIRILHKYTCLWTSPIACEDSQIHLTFGHASTQAPRLVVSEVLIWHAFSRSRYKNWQELACQWTRMSEVNVVVICRHTISTRRSEQKLKFYLLPPPIDGGRWDTLWTLTSRNWKQSTDAFSSEPVPSAHSVLIDSLYNTTPRNVQ